MEYSLCAWEERVLLEGMFCTCLLGHLVYSVVQVHCFLIDFMSERSTHFSGWGMTVPYNCCVVFYFSFTSINIYSAYLGAPMLDA